MKSLIPVILILMLNQYSPGQWNPQNSGTIQSLKTVRFINVNTGYAAGNSGVIVKTNDGGNNWVLLISPVSQQINSLYIFNPLTVILVSNGGFIYRTLNGGSNWALFNSNTTSNLFTVSFADTTNGVSAGSGTILNSTNGGQAWNTAQSGFVVTYYTTQMVNSTTGFIGGVNSIFSVLFGKTTNGGANWTFSSFYVNNNEATMRGLDFINPNEGFAVSIIYNGQGGISHTTNSGTNWTHQIFTPSILAVDFPGNDTGYVCGSTQTIIRTTDRGTTWISQNSGSGILWSINFVNNNTGWTCGDNGVILKTTTGGLTPVIPVGNRIPEEFMLYQNYPNPFNPETKIKFVVAVKQITNLCIYNLLGNKIAILLNESLNPGTYEIKWNASEYPSGIYFYKLIAGNYSETKKMILIK